jgi:hypothetical protein
MLNAIRHSTITTFVWGFMAFYLLNISVDVTSLFDEKEHKHTNYNEQESIVELVFEKVLGFEDAIPENNANDSEHNPTMKKGFSMDKFVLPFFEINPKIVVFNPIKKSFHYSKTIFLKPSLEIHSPPPEV